MRNAIATGGPGAPITTDSSGNPAGNVTAEVTNQATHPAENVYYESFTLDATASDTHTINNAENYSMVELRISSLGGSATISIQGDMSEDQSGDWTAKLACYSQSAHPNSGTANINFTNNNQYAREKCAFSAYKVYVSTTDASGGTPAIAFRMKGLV